MTEQAGLMETSQQDDDAISITSTRDEEFSSDKEFLVERVLAEKRDARNRVIYLIFWAGYPEAESTWEPRKNIQDPAILEAWEERKADEARGAKPVFDVAGFDARAVEAERAKAVRHQRRKAKRRLLGIPVSSSDTEEDTEEDNAPANSDSSQAVEGNELPERESLLKRKRGQRLRRRRDARPMWDSSPEPPPIKSPPIQLSDQQLASVPSENDSSDSSDLDRDRFVGDKKKVQRKTLDALRLQRIARNDPRTSRDAGQSDAERPVQQAATGTSATEIAAPTTIEQQPRDIAGSAQTQVQTAPKPSLPRIPKRGRRPDEQSQSRREPEFIGPQPIAPTRRPSINPSAVRGKGATRGGHAARRNVFERRDAPKRRRNLIETASDPNQEQRLFGNWHMRRKAELAGRSIADAAPDIAALGGLFNPSDPASFQPLRPDTLRRRSSMSMPQDFDDLQESRENSDEHRDELVSYASSLTHNADLPTTSTFSRPTYNYDRHGDNAVCYFWYFRRECAKGFSCRFVHSEDPTLPIVPAPGKTVLAIAEQEKAGARLSELFASASSKRREICFYWNRSGTCSKGEDCDFLHYKVPGLPVASKPSSRGDTSYRQPPKTKAVCKFWLKGFCNRGENCPFAHNSSISDLPAPAISHLGPRGAALDITDDSDSWLPYKEDAVFLDRGSRSETTNINRTDPPVNGDLVSLAHPQSSNADIHRSPISPSIETSIPDNTNAMSATPRAKLSMDEYRQNKLVRGPRADRVKEITFGREELQSVTVDFGDIGEGSQQPWGQMFAAQPAFHFDQICSAYDFQALYTDIQRMMLAGGRLNVNPADEDATGKLNIVAQYLRIYCGGLISVSTEFVVLIYPAADEWKTIGAYGGFSPEDRVRYLIFQPSVKIDQLPLFKRAAPSRSFKKALATTLHDLHYRQLLYSEKEIQHFYLLFPSQAKNTAIFFASWLRGCDPNCKVYSSEIEGSWNFFATDDSIKVGVVLIHESVVPSIPELPYLGRLISPSPNKMFNFWCIDDSGRKYPLFQAPQPLSLGKLAVTRIFPHGHAIFLSPSFLVAEPERARTLISWFRDKLRRTTPGTWKLVCAYDIRTYLLDLANEKALERDQFMEQNYDKPAKDALAGKRGLSYQTCEIRYKCHDIISGIMKENKGPIFYDPYNFDQLVNIDAPIVYADSSIDPDNEQHLIAWFAGWTVKHLDKFRKFTVVGTNSTSYHSAVRIRDLMSRAKIASLKPSASDLSKAVASVSISHLAAQNFSVSSNAETKNAPDPSLDDTSKIDIASVPTRLDATSRQEYGPATVPSANIVDGIAEMDVSPDSDGHIISKVRAVDPESSPELLLFCSTTGCNIRTAQEYLANADNNFQKAVNLYSVHNRVAPADKITIDSQIVELLHNVNAEQARQLPRIVTGASEKVPSFPALSPGAVSSPDTSRDASRRESCSTAVVLSPGAERIDIDSPQHEVNKTTSANMPVAAGESSDASGTEFRYGSTTAWYRNLQAEGKGWEHINVDAWDKCFKHIGLL